ncbi:MAG: hypothetical protein IT477_10975 [Rhodanobacteraceae bacterium]|nr:hypothetical protein [Rhodanobacteraceae bacterium]
MTFLVTVTIQERTFGQVRLTTFIHDRHVVVGDRDTHQTSAELGLDDSLFVLTPHYNISIFPDPHRAEMLRYRLTEEAPEDEREEEADLTSIEGRKLSQGTAYPRISFRWYSAYPAFTFEVEPYQEGMALPFDDESPLLREPERIGRTDVQEVLRQRPERLLRLVSDPRCPPWLLEFFWIFGWVPMQARICLNPNLGRRFLLETASFAYPAVTVMNPQLELLALENPEVLGTMSPQVALALRLRQQS